MSGQIARPRSERSPALPPRELAATATECQAPHEPHQNRTLQAFAENPVHEVQQKLLALEQQLEILAADKKCLEDQIGNSRLQLATSYKEITDVKASVRKLSEQNSVYRGIILDIGSDSTEIPDEKIRQDFVELRDLIQRIVHRHYVVPSHVKLNSHKNRWFEVQKGFRDQLRGLGSESLQRFCMRAKIFNLLDNHLISARNFGVADFEDDLKTFEQALVQTKTGKLREATSYQTADLTFAYISVSSGFGRMAEPHHRMRGFSGAEKQIA
ncbi:MAG: hypothetical protein Q9196_004160 [Gyalolechia fulgens]